MKILPRANTLAYFIRSVRDEKSDLLAPGKISINYGQKSFATLIPKVVVIKRFYHHRCCGLNKLECFHRLIHEIFL
jgi:hypothetical protein